MTVKRVIDLKTPIGEILQGAESDGVLLDPGEESRFAVLPLDEDLLDYLLEHNPKFTKDCHRIREEMRAGQFHTHDEVRRMFGS